MSAISPPLSNVQLELLKIFSTGINDGELAELRTVLANFFADKAILKANEIWDEKGYSNDLMDKWLNKDNAQC